MAKKKRDEEEIQATAAELPLDPPQDAIETVKGWQKKGIMLYRAGRWTDPLTDITEKIVVGKCTVCGKNHNFEYSNWKGGCSCSWAAEQAPFSFIDPMDHCAKATNNDLLCPSCGAEVTAVHISAFKQYYTIDFTNFMTAKVIRGHYVFLGWALQKRCDKEGAVDYILRKMDAMTVIGKSPVRFTGYINCSFNQISYKDEWIARPHYFSDYYDWSLSETIGLNEMDTVGTEIEKSAAVEFLLSLGENVPLAAYLKLWTKYPNVENLVRSGRVKFVNKLIRSGTYLSGWYVQHNSFDIQRAAEHVDFKKVKPHEILGLPKEDVAIADELTIRQLRLYRNVLKREKIKLTYNDIQSAVSLGLEDLAALSEKFNQPIMRIMRYLNKQKQRASFLDDYWRMARAVYNGIPNELMYPKDLKKLHDRVQTIYTTTKNDLFDRNIQIFAKELAVYSFEDPETGLCIRPCRNQKELIAEGKALSHCVASYAEAYATRQTSIFFIRKICQKRKSYYTLEYRDGSVRQNQGKSHISRTEEVKLFEEKWLQHIKEIQLKEKKDARNNRSKAKRASA